MNNSNFFKLIFKFAIFNIQFVIIYILFKIKKVLVIVEKKINPSFKSQTMKNMTTSKGVPYSRGGRSKTCKNKKYKI
jgi:hypothetical protein